MTETAEAPGTKDVLLVESNEADASLLQQWVAETPDLGRGVLCVGTVSEAFAVMEKSDFDAVLLSLDVSDANRLSTLEELRRRSADVPLVVFGTAATGVAGTEVVAAGADDFVSKETWSRAPVAQSIRFAMLRRLPAAFKAPTLRDGLTGLHNLSAFGVIGEHTMHTARRLGTSVAVAVVSPLGPEGQQLDRVDLTHALQSSGRRLRSSCRQSDVVSRVSADQIAVLGIVEGAEGGEALVSRTLEEIARAGVSKGVRWLSGLSVSPAQRSLSLEGLLRRAVKDLEGATRNLARRQFEGQARLPESRPAKA